jgi:hypothetical protein
VAVALEHRQRDVADLGDVPIEAQILEDVVFAQAILLCGRAWLTSVAPSAVRRAGINRREPSI